MCCNLVPGRVKAPLHFLYGRDAVSLIPYLPSDTSIYDLDYLVVRHIFEMVPTESCSHLNE